MALLVKEKELVHARDALSAERRALPWRKIETDYVFDGPDGPRTLGDLFAGRSQLVVYHFMFGPTAEEGCRSCAFWADSFERSVVHLAQRDVTMVAVSRAPVEKLEASKARVGWTFPWFSSGRCDFNRDFRVTVDGKEHPGISVFHRDEAGAIFHTYSTYARGIDAINPTYQILDLVPKGRDEDALSYPMAWVRYRDRYACAGE